MISSHRFKSRDNHGKTIRNCSLQPKVCGVSGAVRAIAAQRAAEREKPPASKWLKRPVRLTRFNLPHVWQGAGRVMGMVKARRRPDADRRRIVCLPAILPDGDQLDDFSHWLQQLGLP